MFVGLFFLPLLPLIIIFVIFRASQRNGRSGSWKWLAVQSQDDFLSQIYFVLATSFGGLTLYALNRESGTIINWQLILFSTSIATIGLAYYYRVLYPLIWGLVEILIWWGVQSSVWVGLPGVDLSIKGAVVILGLVVLCLIYYVLGWLHESLPQWRIEHFSAAYLALGLFPITVILFLFSTREGLSLIEDATRGEAVWASWQLSVVLILLISLLLAMLSYAFQTRSVLVFESAAVFLLVGLFVGLLFLPEQMIFLGKTTSRIYTEIGSQLLTDIGLMWAIVFNLLAFLEMLGVIILGYVKRKIWLINFGVFFMFILVLIKYFDWFFSFLDKSLFFVGAGILFFIVGWLMERGRKYMLKKVQVEE